MYSLKEPYYKNNNHQIVRLMPFNKTSILAFKPLY
jgi:hypothetical protein